MRGNSPPENCHVHHGFVPFYYHGLLIPFLELSDMAPAPRAQSAEMEHCPGHAGTRACCQDLGCE